MTSDRIFNPIERLSVCLIQNSMPLQLFVVVSMTRTKFNTTYEQSLQGDNED